MSTRGLIAVKRSDGIHAIYCHCDAYPEYPGLGYRLLNYYNSSESANGLINAVVSEDCGITGLENTLEDTLSEKNIFEMDKMLFHDKKDYAKNHPWDIEYLYLWDNGWKLYNNRAFRKIPEKYAKML